MKEHIVVLHEDADYWVFYDQMENTTSDHDHIPDRAVEIANEQPYIDRLCNYYLTEEEALKLKNDPRVAEIEDPATKEVRAVVTQTNVAYTKTTSGSGSIGNWGLKRCNSATNNYGTSSTDPGGGYTYTLDGTGVDIIVVDSGIEVNHPEWQDANGVSRLQQIDWFRTSGVTGNQSAYHYRDYSGHGTHVTGIIAGKTFGWAKNAKIYNLKLYGLEGSFDVEPSNGALRTGIYASDMYNCIIGFHNKKPVDPVTGLKRPTVVNMSWAYIDTFANCTGGNYRGATNWTSNAKQSVYGMIFNGNTFGKRYASDDTSIEAMISAGIHVCIAAGNFYQKIDVSAGVDYNNYWVDSSNVRHYYHRGNSPYSDNAIIVGAIRQTSFSASLDQRANFSNTGPAVTVYAPGSYQMSATSQLTSDITANGYTPGTYYADGNYKQASIQGTSQASPQVAGVAALYLQLNPRVTPAFLRTWIINQSKATLTDTGLNNDYTSTTSLMGGNNRMLFNPFNAGSENLFNTTTITPSGGVTFRLGYASFTGLDISDLISTKTSLQLNSRLSGPAPGESIAVFSNFGFNGTQIVFVGVGLPYHSFGNSVSSNIASNQNLNKQFTYNGGKNTAGTQPTRGVGRIGIAINGVSIYSPSAGTSVPTGKPSFASWTYNAAYTSASSLNYSFGQDLAGGVADSNGCYNYKDGTFITGGAWANGTGYVSGLYGTTGLAEVSVIPYLNGGLLHPDGHSKIVGWAADGYPIYGPYGYTKSLDNTSKIKNILSGYTLNSVRLGTSPIPNTATYPLGIFIEDYSFTNSGDLDQFNGRFCVTPDFPAGTYAYFLTIDNSGNPAYPYAIGNNFYGTPAQI